MIARLQAHPSPTEKAAYVQCAPITLLRTTSTDMPDSGVVVDTATGFNTPRPNMLGDFFIGGLRGTLLEVYPAQLKGAKLLALARANVSKRGAHYYTLAKSRRI
jgi:hypothetical protein